MPIVGCGSGMNSLRLTNYFSCILSYTKMRELIALMHWLLILPGFSSRVPASAIIRLRHCIT